PGVRYEIDREYENWVRIVNEEDGTKGFVRCSDVSVRYTLNQPYFYTANDLDYQFRQSIINYAYQFLGLKYVWAGTSLTEGADCSGFVLRIYEHFRILLPRTSLSQSEFGTPVNSIAEAKVGDLIFYYGYSESGVRTEGVGHVAIYMGNGMIIHCARNSGVIVTPYDYRDQPLYIRRVIQ
ncbi:MAG: C40 family peptidase, partial [Lachnospiraceae bacterium]|nr:C40 family peptidase [Lachnospiraceae bacterium]